MRSHSKKFSVHYLPEATQAHRRCIMRWRIPLVAVFALFMAVSCDQQLVEPPTDEAAASPLFAPNSNANKFVWHGDDSWVLDCGGESLDVTMVGWGQFMPKTGSRSDEVDVFHLVFTYTNGDGDTFVWRDVGPDHWYCSDSECFVTVTGTSTASGTTGRDEIVVGHVVMKLDGPFGNPIEVVFVAGRALGSVDDLACDALT
jgi:hypothetical protein